MFAAEAVLGPQYFFAHYSDMHTLAVMLRVSGGAGMYAVDVLCTLVAWWTVL